jgi:hypothetical protein
MWVLGPKESLFLCMWSGIKKLEKKWCILNVYGAAHEEKKQDFLRELASFYAKCKDLYIVGVTLIY